MMRPDLFTQADFGTTVGSGHVSRQIALSAAWQKFGGTAWLQTDSVPNSRVANQAAGLGVKLTSQLIDGDAIAIDSYSADLNTRLDLIRDRPCLELDDFCQVAMHPGDILLDQNFGATPETSGRPYRGSTWGLYGPRFALLRPEFRTLTGKRRMADAQQSVGLLLGGNPNRLTFDRLKEELRRAFPDVRLVVADGSITDMANFYSDIDVAVSAAGSTVLELAAYGLPMVIVSIADNQNQVARSLSNLGLAMTSSIDQVPTTLRQLLSDRDLQSETAARLRQSVDGFGAERVATFLAAHLLNVRRVVDADAALLFQWSNDPQTRQNSFSSDPISWSEHLDWFNSKMKSFEDDLFIIEDESVPIGHVRFTNRRDCAEISITVCPTVRGSKLGGRIIRAAVNRFRLEAGRKSVEIRALIKPTNIPSIGAFRSASFIQDAQERDPLLYVDRCDDDIILYREHQSR